MIEKLAKYYFKFIDPQQRNWLVLAGIHATKIILSLFMWQEQPWLTIEHLFEASSLLQQLKHMPALTQSRESGLITEVSM